MNRHSLSTFDSLYWENPPLSIKSLAPSSVSSSCSIATPPSSFSLHRETSMHVLAPSRDLHKAQSAKRKTQNAKHKPLYSESKSLSTLRAMPNPATTVNSDALRKTTKKPCSNTSISLAQIASIIYLVTKKDQKSHDSLRSSQSHESLRSNREVIQQNFGSPRRQTQNN